MTVSEQIRAWLAKRAEHVQRMQAMVTLAAGSGDNAQPRDFTQDEQTAFDAAEAGIKAADAQIARLRSLEAIEAAGAQPAPAPGQPTPPAQERGAPNPDPNAPPVPTPGAQVIPYKAFPGQAFVRMVASIMMGGPNNWNAAADIARRYKDQTPQVEQVLRTIAQTGEMPANVLRAAVAAGTTTGATWAAPLVYAANMTSEFIELLRPATVLGRLPFRTVPFNVSIPRQTGGAAAGWVGEGLSKPVQKLDFDRLAIPWAKIAVIAVITQELARFSNPAAEMLIRDDLINAIAQFKDVQLLDPSVTASAGVRPASITNGVTPITAPTDMTPAAIDIALVAALMALNTANIPMTAPRWIMNGSTRIMLQNLRSSQDVPAYPEVSSGMLKGYPIVESNNIPIVAGGGGNPPTSQIILVDAAQILHAEDPVIDIAISTEASLQMDSAPATPPTTPVSLFQQNLMAIKAEQYEYWVKRYASAVQVIDDVPIGPDVA